MDELDEAELPQRLIEARNALKYNNQAEMAMKIGISRSLLQKYEAGTSMPGTGMLAKFSKLGINIHWLVTGKGPMFYDGSVKTVASMSDNVTTAVSAVENALDQVGLKAGTKLRSWLITLAIEVLQAHAASEDFVFDMMLKVTSLIKDSNNQRLVLPPDEMLILEKYRNSSDLRKKIILKVFDDDAKDYGQAEQKKFAKP